MVPSNDFKETADKKLKTFSIVIYTTYLKASFSHQLPEEKRKKMLKRELYAKKWYGTHVDNNVDEITL